MKCPECGQENKFYWYDALHKGGTKYYRCTGCLNYYDSGKVAATEKANEKETKE